MERGKLQKSLGFAHSNSDIPYIAMYISSIRYLAAALLGVALSLPLFADEALRSRLKDDHSRKGDHWIYNDIERGFAEAVEAVFGGDFDVGELAHGKDIDGGDFHGAPPLGVAGRIGNMWGLGQQVHPQAGLR